MSKGMAVKKEKPAVVEEAVVGGVYAEIKGGEEILLTSRVKGERNVFFVSATHGMCKMPETLFLSQWKRVR